MELELEVIQRESYIWQSDKAIRQSDEVIAQSDEEVVDDWHLLLFGKSMQNILNYTSENAELINKDEQETSISDKEKETAIMKAVD
jgi:hypothetical protein